MTAITPTTSNVLTQLRAFLLDVLPAGVIVAAAQQNRVPEPKTADFVLMTPIRFERLATNVDASADVKFTGSIAGTAMTATFVALGEITPGATLFGVGVTAGTTIVSQSSGTPGGAGDYVVSQSQAVGSETLSCGAKTMQQSARVVVQLDFHGPDISSAGDMAQTVSTLLRDEYGVTQFANQSPNYGVVPLFADDPRQSAFVNDQSQWETTFVLEVHLQVYDLVSVPQQFSDSAVVTPISVEATYPP